MSAVIGITLIGALAVGLFIFKDKIASFASGGLTDIGSGIDQAGKDLEQFGKDQQKAFDDFVLKTQGDIDKSLKDTQQGIGEFFEQSQKNLNQGIAGIQTGIDDTLKGITDPLDQFAKDSQKNIADANQGILDFFGSIFGGQSPTKEIPKEIFKTPPAPTDTGSGRGGRKFPERSIAPFVLSTIAQEREDKRLGIFVEKPTKPTTISNKTSLAQQELSKKFGITTFDLKGNATFRNGIAVGSITDSTQKEVENKSANKTRFGSGSRPTLTKDLINVRPIDTTNIFRRRTGR